MRFHTAWVDVCPSRRADIGQERTYSPLLFISQKLPAEGNLEKDLHSLGCVLDVNLRNRFVQIHIIYTRTGMLLSKHPYQSWIEIQDQYPDYMTSLGPWEEETVIEYLADEYPELFPHPQEQVIAFIADTPEARVLTFAA